MKTTLVNMICGIPYRHIISTMTLHSILQYYVLFGCIIVIDIKLKVYCCLLEAAKEGGLHTLFIITLMMLDSVSINY